MQESVSTYAKIVTRCGIYFAVILALGAVIIALVYVCNSNKGFLVDTSFAFLFLAVIITLITFIFATTTDTILAVWRRLYWRGFEGTQAKDLKRVKEASRK